MQEALLEEGQKSQKFVEEIREGYEGNHLLVVRQGLPMIGCRYIVLSSYATMVA